MKQEGDMSIKVKCPKCEYPYRLQKPKDYMLVRVGNKYITLLKNAGKLSLILAGLSSGVLISSGIGSIFSSIIFGPENTVKVSRHHPFIFMLSSVAIPPVLVYGGCNSNWEGPVMKYIAKKTEDETSYKNTVNRVDKSIAPIFNNPKTVLAMKSLAFPCIGSFIGRQFFNGIKIFQEDADSLLKTFRNLTLRALAGSGIYFLVNSTVKIKYLYDLMQYHKKAQILDYDPGKEKENQTPRVAHR